MISIVKPDQSYSRHNVTVQCPCGRSLRAKVEAAGTEIQCWDCRRKVAVPFPRSAVESLQALRRGWDDVFETGLFTALVGAAAVLTLALIVPKAGAPLGLFGLVLAAFGYGELVRRAGEPEGDGVPGADANPEPSGPFCWLARGAAALAFGVGLGAPFLLARGGVGRPAQLAGWLVPAVVTVALTVLPLATLAAFDPAGPRVVPAMLRWRRRSTLLSLASLPALLVLLECALVFITFFVGILGGFLLDLTAPPPFVLRRLGVPPDWLYHFGEPADVTFLSVYLNRLSHGYTLIGTIPPSLTVPSDIGPQFWSSALHSNVYLFLRAALTLLINTVVLSGLALQACWLGRIGRIEGRIGAKTALAVASPAV